MKTTTPMRLRVSRFLSERYAQREQPSYLPELFLFAVIVLIVSWPLFSVLHAMANGNWIGTLARIWF